MTEGYTRVASTDEVPPGAKKKVNFAGKDLLLVNIDGQFFAIGAECTHVGGPLDEGTLHNHEVECPWHGSRFDLRTGAVTHGPARLPEPSYEVKIEDTTILLRAR